MKATRRIVTLGCLAVLAGCGSDYVPPDLETTGQPAGPLGQVLDVDVEFPDLRVTMQGLGGVSFEMRVELERAGFGEIPATVYYGDAQLATDSVPIKDLTDGRTTITITPDRWSSGRLGPLRVADTTFEMILDGRIEEGHRVSGRALGSLSMDVGTFEGWRRRRFLVTTTDFFSTSGRVEEVSLVRERELRVRRRLELVSSDAILSVANGAVFAINRLTFDNLQRLDPLSDFVTVWQGGVGAGANPQDALRLSGNRGYVSRYEPPYNDIGIFDTETGEIIGQIPLGDLAENRDGTPRPTAMTLASGTLFVALQDIDRSFTMYGEGKLAVIDPQLDRVLDVIPLGGRNPVQIERLVDGEGREQLYVALAGIFPGLQDQELSGGVVVIDALNRVVDRVALDDDVAGGNIGALAMVRETLGYVVVSDQSFVNRVLAFDPANGTVLRTVLETNEFIPEITVDSSGLLAVPDRRFFEPQTCLYRTPDEAGEVEILVHCIALELPPFSIEALD